MEYPITDCNKKYLDGIVRVAKSGKIEGIFL